jgi:CheY-like chemotaxis protein
MNILVIDDSCHSILYKSKLLPLKGDTTCVNSWKEASKAIKNDSFDLVLVSHLFGEVSGVDIVDKIRQDGYTGKIVVSYTGTQHLERSQYNGCISGMVNKAINTNDFLEFLDKVLKDEYFEEEEPKKLDVS